MSNSEAQSQAVAATTVEGEASLLDQILNETKMTPRDEGYDVAQRGVAAFIGELVKPTRARREGRQARSSTR